MEENGHLPRRPFFSIRIPRMVGRDVHWPRQGAVHRPPARAAAIAEAECEGERRRGRSHAALRHPENGDVAPHHAPQEGVRRWRSRAHARRAPLVDETGDRGRRPVRRSVVGARPLHRERAPEQLRAASGGRHAFAAGADDRRSRSNGDGAGHRRRRRADCERARRPEIRERDLGSHAAHDFRRGRPLRVLRNARRRAFAVRACLVVRQQRCRLIRAARCTGASERRAHAGSRRAPDGACRR